MILRLISGSSNHRSGQSANHVRPPNESSEAAQNPYFPKVSEPTTLLIPGILCIEWFGLDSRRFKGDVFNAFFKVIPNFYSCETNVEFSGIVCFDDIDIIG